MIGRPLCRLLTNVSLIKWLARDGWCIGWDLKKKFVADSHSWKYTKFSVFKCFAENPQVSTLLMNLKSLHDVDYILTWEVIGNYVYIGTFKNLFSMAYCKWFLFLMIFLNTGKSFVKCFAKLPCRDMSSISADYFVCFCKNNSHLCLIHLRWTVIAW